MRLKEVPCDICGSEDVSAINVCRVTRKDADMEECVLTLVRCRACGLVFVNPRPVFSKEEIERLYSKEYFDAPYMKFYGAQKREAIQSNEDFTYRLSMIEKFKTGSRMLDVGCASGEFLKMAKQRGWEVRGVDLSEYAAGMARSEHGIDVFKGTLEGARFSDGEFDAVICGDVLEHVRSPRAFLKEVERILKPGGIVYIATPDFGSFHYRLMSFVAKLTYKNYFVLPHHLYHFTGSTLKRLLEISGFKIEKAVRSQSRYTDKGLKAFLASVIFLIGQILNMPDRIIMIARKA